MDRIDTQASKGVLRGLKAREAAAVVRAEPASATAAGTPRAEPAVVASIASAGPEAPVDGDRVAVIREAVEQGRYPVLPTKIADAMIAAGYLLRSK
jgi:negative regulator of flagellin synthesis FlgM